MFVIPCIQQIQRLTFETLQKNVLSLQFWECLRGSFYITCVSSRISLNTLTLNVKSDKVYTRHGVPISVTGIAQVGVFPSDVSDRTCVMMPKNKPKTCCPQMKIQGQNKQMLAAACQMFMGKSEGEIAQIALETLEGHQRAIIAHLTVEVGCFVCVVGRNRSHRGFCCELSHVELL